MKSKKYYVVTVNGKPLVGTGENKILSLVERAKRYNPNKTIALRRAVVIAKGGNCENK